MRTLEEITEKLTLEIVWPIRGSGYGQYTICFEYQFGRATTVIKYNFTDSQIWDEYQEIDDYTKSVEFLQSRFSRKFDDSKESAASYFFHNQ